MSWDDFRKVIRSFGILTKSFDGKSGTEEDSFCVCVDLRYYWVMSFAIRNWQIKMHSEGWGKTVATPIKRTSVEGGERHSFVARQWRQFRSFAPVSNAITLATWLLKLTEIIQQSLRERKHSLCPCRRLPYCWQQQWCLSSETIGDYVWMLHQLHEKGCSRSKNHLYWHQTYINLCNSRRFAMSLAFEQNRIAKTIEEGIAKI